MESRDMNLKCGAVILAAGNSSRLGQPKQLVCCGEETLLARTVRIAEEAGCLPIIVVLGYDADHMTSTLTGRSVRIVRNPAWSTGMASSLQAGLAAWSGSAIQNANVLLLVCDQPQIGADDLRELLAIHTSESRQVTAASYAGRLGVPAIFHRNLLQELMAITGDQGARAVIERHKVEAGILPLPAAELDVDLPGDLRLVETRRIRTS